MTIPTNISLHKIYLDNDNPRHDPIQNEKDVITYLIEHEDIKALAKDIAQNGGTSPIELLALFPHPKIKDAYIPAEGNRRICALKLLLDPDKANNEANKSYFRNLKSNWKTAQKSISAVIFRDRTAANHWVSLRHEGLQGGVGTKPWTPQQKARFSMQKGGSNANSQSTLLIDFARGKGLLTDEELANLRVTTITRYLSNPVFRDVLGLKDNHSLNITVPIDEFSRVVQKFLTDSNDPKSGVSSRSSAEDRKAYANQLRKSGIAPSTTGQASVNALAPAQPSSAPESPESSGQKPTKRNNRSRLQDKHVVPSGFAIKVKDPVTKRVYDELRGLPVDTYPFSCAFLFRSFIEQAATQYLKKFNIPVPDKLHEKLSQLAKQLSAGGMPSNRLKSLRTMAPSKDSRASADTLGAFVHGGAIPTKADLLSAWDGVQDVIEKVFESIQ